MDKYDRAIGWLNAQPDFRSAVQFAWFISGRRGEDQSPASCLFLPTGTKEQLYETKTIGVGHCGCLSQLRDSPRGHPTALSTATLNELVKDTRIPTKPADITPESLDAFAEWQRRIDKELGRCKMMLK